MAWTLDGIRIFVQEDNLEGGQIIPRLQPLSGGTIKQIFGYESPVKSIAGIVVGATDASLLIAMTQDATPHTLIDPTGYSQGLYVNKVSLKRLSVIYQTLRPDLDCESPVYSFNIVFA